MKKLHYDGPVVLVVMDGVGLSPRRSGNAVRQAHTEFLDMAMGKYLNIPLQASGEAVGIMPRQMGNSEVGHNAIGSGQIIKQGIAQVEAAFKTGDIWLSKAWRGAMEQLGIKHDQSGQDATKQSQDIRARDGKAAKATGGNSVTVHFGGKKTKKSAKATAADFWRQQAEKKNRNKTPATLHFCGIFSDGGVHSDINHLEQMIRRAYDEGVRRIRIHAVFDGRDVAPQSEPKYIKRLEKFCSEFKDADFRIASGGGREMMVADRYENDWGKVKLGWDAIVHGKAPREFRSATEAIKVLRSENPKVQDQYLPAFVIIENDAAKSALSARAERAKESSASSQHGAKPIGKVQDGDAFIYYDFRADRAVEFSEAFVAEDFGKFDRSVKDQKITDGKNNPAPKVFYAGLTEYDKDRHIPEHILVPPIQIKTPLNTFLGKSKISQLAVSETLKFGHITYYFNGNSYKKAPREQHIEIKSDYKAEALNNYPWMKAGEVTDVVLENMDKYQFVRINYPNGDMIGHFADLEAGIVAIEAVDLQLRRLAQKVDELGGMMILTADHGNLEELIDKEGVPKTSHTTNPVPCIFYDNTKNAKKYQSAQLQDAGLTNLAATIALLLGENDYPADWREPLIRI